MTFTTKCVIYRSCIHSIGFYSSFILLCGTVLCIFPYVYRIMNTSEQWFAYNSFIVHISYFDFCHYCAGFVINFITTLRHCQNYVRLIMRLQRIHRILFIKKFFYNFIITCFVYIVLINIFYLLIITFFIITNVNLFEWISAYVLICFDVNVMCSFSFVKFMKTKLELWIKRIKLYEFTNEYEEIYLKKMFQCYNDILYSFNLCSKIYCLTVCILPLSLSYEKKETFNLF